MAILNTVRVTYETMDALSEPLPLADSAIIDWINRLAALCWNGSVVVEAAFTKFTNWSCSTISRTVAGGTCAANWQRTSVPRAKSSVCDGSRRAGVLSNAKSVPIKPGSATTSSLL